MAMHITPSIIHVSGDTLLRHEEKLSIAIKRADMWISDAKESGCAHLIEPRFLEEIQLSKQSLEIVEKELIRRSSNN